MPAVNDVVTLNGPTITLLAGIGSILSAVIIALFRLLLGRMDRAEKQVDTLLPATQAMIEQLRGLREDLARSLEAVRVLREELSRQQGRTT